MYHVRYDPHLKYQVKSMDFLACITMVTRHCVYYDRYVTDGAGFAAPLIRIENHDQTNTSVT
jgi:hypothetical protein